MNALGALEYEFAAPQIAIAAVSASVTDSSDQVSVRGTGDAVSDGALRDATMGLVGSAKSKSRNVATVRRFGWRRFYNVSGDSGVQLRTILVQKATPSANTANGTGSTNGAAQKSQICLSPLAASLEVMAA